MPSDTTPDPTSGRAGHAVPGRADPGRLPCDRARGSSRAGTTSGPSSARSSDDPRTTSSSSTTAPVRQRAPPLRPPAHRLREGRRPPLPDHAGPPGRTSLRLGLPRPAGRDADREGARRLGPGRDHRVRHRASSTRPAGPRSCASPGEWERYVTRQARWVDFDDDYKTMDDVLHGVGHLGVRPAVGQGSHLRGVPGHALLVGCRDAAVELRDPPRRRHPSPPGPGADRRLQRRGDQRRGGRPAEP